MFSQARVCCAAINLIPGVTLGLRDDTKWPWETRLCFWMEPGRGRESDGNRKSS